MADMGRINRLKILRSCEHGLLLDGGADEILLPRRYVREEMKPGGSIEVFVMRDSQDRLMATTDRPRVMVGEFALLQVKDVTAIGAFLDWGMPKDLFVPFREQRIKMRQGQSYLVHVYLDRVSDRITASSKLDKFLEGSRRYYKQNEAVDLMVWQPTDLGCKCIINNERWGMVFHNEIFRPLHRGEHIRGFIKRVRPDGRIDLALQKPGYEKVTDLSGSILNYLREQGGFMPITDKTPPETISSLFNVSKKTYKKAIGALYRKRLIEFDEQGTRLVKPAKRKESS